MNNFKSANQNVREIISCSKVPEDPIHAENTLEWLLRIDPLADHPMQIAALAHDIDRADDKRKVRRADFTDYDAFKSAHAVNGAKILEEILNKFNVSDFITKEACRLVILHEVGGDPRSDLLKDADSISFFDVNMPLYYKREGLDETRKRCIWGYKRLSTGMKKFVKGMKYEDEVLNQLIKEITL
ncbi:MAG: DUF4202 family protein [Candidatus Anammoxibacter sp.]